MSVLKGEGKVPILFGTRSVVAGAVTRDAYLARPDLTGEWPTLIVVPSAWGVTSSMKDLARRIARRGVAVVVVDLFAGKGPERRADRETAEATLRAIPATGVRRALADAINYTANRAGFWSSAERGLAIMGIGDGGPHAIDAALDADAALILVSSPLPTEQLSRVAAPVLGLFGRDDESVSVDEVMEARSVVPHAEWVLYDGVGREFVDDHLAEYDDEASRDAVERIVDFCEKHLSRRG